MTRNIPSPLKYGPWLHYCYNRAKIPAGRPAGFVVGPPGDRSLHEQNPYEAPTDALRSVLPTGNANPRVGLGAYMAWIGVFVLNMAVPLLFGASMTQEHGRLGMSVAALLLLAVGCFICAASRKLARHLIVGGALVGLAQLYPILQIIAGMIGMAAGQALGMAELDDDARSPGVSGELGGFVVTFVTGTILIAAGACAGMLLRLLTPARWWQTHGALRSRSSDLESKA